MWNGNARKINPNNLKCIFSWKSARWEYKQMPEPYTFPWIEFGIRLPTAISPFVFALFALFKENVIVMNASIICLSWIVCCIENWKLGKGKRQNKLKFYPFRPKTFYNVQAKEMKMENTNNDENRTELDFRMHNSKMQNANFFSQEFLDSHRDKKWKGNLCLEWLRQLDSFYYLWKNK